MGNSGCFPQGKPAATVALPNLLCMLGVLVFHAPPNSDMDYGIFNVRTYVNACDSTWGVYGHRKKSALKFTRKNSSLHREIEPASATYRSDAPPTELHPHPQQK